MVKVALCNRSRTDAIVKIDVDAARPSAFRVRHHQVPICLSISFNGKIVYKFIHMPCALPCAVRDVHRSSSDALRLKTKCTPLSLLAASLLSLTRLPNLPPPHTPSPSLAASLSCSISPPIHPALRSLCHGHLGAGTRRALCDAAGLLCACGARQDAAQTLFLMLSSGLDPTSRPQRHCNLKVRVKGRERLQHAYMLIARNPPTGEIQNQELKQSPCFPAHLCRWAKEHGDCFPGFGFPRVAGFLEITESAGSCMISF